MTPVLSQNARNSGCRVSDEWTYRGLRTLVMENDALRLVVLLDQGSDIISLEYKSRGIDVLWKNPNGGVLPASHHIASRALPEGSFADFHEGGWQECFPNGGRVCSYRGAEFGLHGEVYGLPWDCAILEDAPDRATVRLATRTRRTPFLVEKTLRLEAGRAALEIEETVTNEGMSAMPFMWGHHPAFGAPFLSGDCVITTGARTARLHNGDDPLSRFSAPLEGPLPLLRGRDGAEVNILRPPAEGEVVSDMFYLTDLEDGFYAMTNPSLAMGFAFEFDPKVFSCIWYWIACGAPAGAPFWGRPYTLALEPFTSWPAILENAMANNTHRELGPGESLNTTLRAGFFAGSEAPSASAEIDYATGAPA